MPVKLHIGNGEFNKIGKYIKQDFNVKNILLVTEKVLMEKLELKERLLKQLKDCNLTIFEYVEPNPHSKIIEKGKRLAQKNKIELIIAIGGGSAMDTGKAIAMLMTNAGTINDYIHKRRIIGRESIPLIAIPTTSGTGSEVTIASVITDEETGIKMGIRSEYMYPNIAIIDPELTLTMPKHITAHTGYDVLAQAVESCLSNSNKNPISKMFALKAITMVFDNLKTAVDQPENIDARTNMALASLYAGLAFTQTGTVGPHSFSCPLTTFHNINHGYACILPLPAFLNIYAEKCGKEVKNEILEMANVVDCKTVEEFGNKMKKLIKDTGEKTRLSELGITQDDKARIIKNTMDVLTGRDPIEITEEVVGMVFDETF
ncbi:MAG: iron-containing alcohol dehydrogenase [Nanoarchaeota archaeon]|nr:iron-containing alcohol dehydrogenase [Nanoarchaeota archaeon]